jgi:hypothetical protein
MTNASLTNLISGSLLRRGFLLVSLALVLLPFFLVQRADCATRNAASPQYSDVNFAVNGGGPDSSGVTFNGAAADGDTVVIPVGIASWTSALIITHGITLQGQTVITGDHTTTPNMTAADYTVIQDDSPRGGNKALISDIALTLTQSVRITGLTLRYGLSVTSYNSNGILRLFGTCPSFRVDHCHFDQLYGYNFASDGWLYGVIDHCIFDLSPGSGAMIVWHSRWGNQPNGWGSWADPAYFGSEKFVFIEDNTVNSLGTKPGIACPYGWAGGRFVLRYNVIKNGSTFGHGTETTQNTLTRGVRAAEIYGNTYSATITMPMSRCRGGALPDAN